MVQARRRLRRHRDRRLRQRPERHGQRHRRLVGIRSGARLQWVGHLHQGAGRRHEGHGLDHRLPGRTDRLRPEHALLPLRLRQHERRQRQRLPVHHRQLLSHLRRDGQLVDRADHQAVRLPQPDPRRVEAHHLRADRFHGRALRGRRRGRPQHLGHHHARRHRLRHHQGQLHRQVRLRRRQALQGPDTRLPGLRPGTGRLGGRAALPARRHAGRRRRQGGAEPGGHQRRHLRPGPAHDRPGRRLLHQLGQRQPVGGVGHRQGDPPRGRLTGRPRHAHGDPEEGHRDRHQDLRRHRPARSRRRRRHPAGRRGAHGAQPRRRTRQPHPAQERRLRHDRDLVLREPGRRLRRRRGPPPRARRRRHHRRPDRHRHQGRGRSDPRHDGQGARTARRRGPQGLHVQLLHRRGHLRRRTALRRPQQGQRPAALARTERRQAGPHLHARREGPARPVHHPLPGGRQVLPDRHRPEDLRQRRLGRLPAHRQQVHHGVGVHRPGALDEPAPGQGLTRQRGQHLGAGGVLRRRARRVRRLLGVEAVRQRRPLRRHVQPHDVRHHPRLLHLQRAQGLDRPRLLGHRLHDDPARRDVLPPVQGRAEQLLLHPPTASSSSRRRATRS
ncbi:hypothetical protein QF034_000938 [Streptomyces africanus]|uniref:Uncharacterized protein n=1 Tax=Streptomyces africanus TaxID=231024 RepID=A0ABU0QH46_9ACTN|nr:hypothetical protein [Streptomyces africanus]